MVLCLVGLVTAGVCIRLIILIDEQDDYSEEAIYLRQHRFMQHMEMRKDFVIETMSRLEKPAYMVFVNEHLYRVSEDPPKIHLGLGLTPANQDSIESSTRTAGESPESPIEMGDPLTEEDNDTLKTSQPPQTSVVEDTVTAGNGEEEEKVETDVSLGFTSEDNTGDATAATEEQPNPISGDSIGVIKTSSPKKVPEKRKRQLCSICFDMEEDSVFIPCGHGGICMNCAVTSYIYSLRCPFCRLHPDQIVNIGPPDQRIVLPNGDTVVPVVGPDSETIPVHDPKNPHAQDQDPCRDCWTTFCSG